MVRVNSCCCGCTLRTGTLIILWLTVIVDGLLVLQYAAGPPRSTGGSSMIGLRILELAVAAIALYGVYEKRPSFLLPYIGLSFFVIIILLIIVFLLIVASSLITNSGVLDQIFNSMPQEQQSGYSGRFSNNNEYQFTANSHHNADIAKAATTTFVVVAVVSMLIILAVESYFTVVVYSLYKQMVESFKGTGASGGVVYSAPGEQGVIGGGGGYPPQQPGYPQPQQQSYPPSYGQQPGGVYPPLSEVKQ